MAVTEQTPRDVSTAAAGASVFPYSFKINADDQVQVQVNGIDRQLGVHFTVSGVGMQSGGDITFLTPLAAGDVVMRRRNMRFERQTDYQNLGDLRSPTLNNDQDDPVMMIQQLADGINRSLKLPLSSTGSGEISSMTPLGPLVVSANGNGVEVGSTTLTGDMLLRPNLADGNTAGRGAALVAVKPPGVNAVARTLADDLRDRPAPVGGFATLQDAINAAPLGGEVIVPGGTTVTLSSLPTNQRGVRVVGQGKVMVTDGLGGYEQANSYRYTKPIFTGKEYLWALYNVMNVTNRAIRCYAYGDSTVEGGTFIDAGNYVQQLLPDLVAAKGVRNRFSTTNRGVGGSNLSTWNPTPDIGANSPSASADLVILKCGINDGSFPVGSRLDTFRTNLRAGLAAIRAVSGGDVGGTAIVIMGPNVTIDKETRQRNVEWYEQLRGIFDSACADYKCAFFDTYQYLQDAGNRDGSLWASARWINQDSTAGNPLVALHPRNVGQLWIWGALIDSIFGESDIVRWSSNRFYARSAYFGFPYAQNPNTWYPINYGDGLTTEIARAADGFPMDGLLTTVKIADGVLMQTLSQQGSGGLIMTRTSIVSENYWSIWSGQAVAIGSGGSSFGGGWTNFGGIYGGARATLGQGGVVTLDGMIKPGATTAGTTVLTLPTGMAPGNQRILAAPADSGMVQFELTSGGQLQIKTGSPASYVSLAGLSFRR